MSKLPFTLDLEVTVYNINTDTGHELLSRCEPLLHYQTFVELVRRFNEDTKNPDTAMEMARNECRRRGILTKYLPKPIKEVDAMQLCEVTEEDVYELWKEEARAEGLEEGRAESMEEGIEKVIELIEQGYSLDEIKKTLAKKRQA